MICTIVKPVIANFSVLAVLSRSVEIPGWNPDRIIGEETLKRAMSSDVLQNVNAAQRAFS